MLALKNIVNKCVLKILFFSIVTGFFLAVNLQWLIPIEFTQFWFDKLHWLILMVVPFFYYRDKSIKTYWSDFVAHPEKLSGQHRLLLAMLVVLPWIVIVIGCLLILLAYIAYLMNSGIIQPS